LQKIHDLFKYFKTTFGLMRKVVIPID